jgi:hypothetical protein
VKKVGEVRRCALLIKIRSRTGLSKVRFFVIRAFWERIGCSVVVVGGYMVGRAGGGIQVLRRR